MRSEVSPITLSQVHPFAATVNRAIRPDSNSPNDKLQVNRVIRPPSCITDRLNLLTTLLYLLYIPCLHLLPQDWGFWKKLARYSEVELRQARHRGKTCRFITTDRTKQWKSVEILPNTWVLGRLH